MTDEKVPLGDMTSKEIALDDNARWVIGPVALSTRPVIGFMLACPAWFNDVQRAAFKLIIEQPTTLEGLRTGLRNTAGKNSTEGVYLKVTDRDGSTIARAVESVILDPRTDQKNLLAGFEVLYIEPTRDYLGVQDAWYFSTAAFEEPFCERDATRNLQREYGEDIEYDFTLRPGNVVYGPEARRIGQLKLDELNAFGDNPNHPLSLEPLGISSELFGKVRFSKDPANLEREDGWVEYGFGPRQFRKYINFENRPERITAASRDGMFRELAALVDQMNSPFGPQLEFRSASIATGAPLLFNNEK